MAYKLMWNKSQCYPEYDSIFFMDVMSLRNWCLSTSAYLFPIQIFPNFDGGAFTFLWIIQGGRGQTNSTGGGGSLVMYRVKNPLLVIYGERYGQNLWGWALGGHMGSKAQFSHFQGKGVGRPGSLGLKCSYTER